MHDADRDRDFDRIAAELRRANRAIQPPPELVESIGRSIRAAAWRRRLAIGTPLAAAAVIALLAVGWWLSVGVQSNSTSPAVARDTVPRPEPSPVPETRVRVAGDFGHFTRPVPTSNPNVTVVLIYRDETARRNRTPDPQGDQS